jgi:hypothetical protein
MAQSVTRRIERNLTASVAFEPGQLIRPRSAESIKASGYVRPRRKAGHMTASDHCSSRKKFLQAGGHPHMRRLYDCENNRVKHAIRVAVLRVMTTSACSLWAFSSLSSIVPNARSRLWFRSILE